MEITLSTTSRQTFGDPARRGDDVTRRGSPGAASRSPEFRDTVRGSQSGLPHPLRQARATGCDSVRKPALELTRADVAILCGAAAVTVSVPPTLARMADRVHPQRLRLPSPVICSTEDAIEEGLVKGTADDPQHNRLSSSGVASDGVRPSRMWSTSAGKIEEIRRRGRSTSCGVALGERSRTLVYTSGTPHPATRRARAVARQHRQHRGRHVRDAYSGAATSACPSLPLSHILEAELLHLLHMFCTVAYPKRNKVGENLQEIHPTTSPPFPRLFEKMSGPDPDTSHASPGSEVRRSHGRSASPQGIVLRLTRTRNRFRFAQDSIGHPTRVFGISSIGSADACCSLSAVRALSAAGVVLIGAGLSFLEGYDGPYGRPRTVISLTAPTSGGSARSVRSWRRRGGEDSDDGEISSRDPTSSGLLTNPDARRRPSIRSDGFHTVGYRRARSRRLPERSRDRKKDIIITAYARTIAPQAAGRAAQEFAVHRHAGGSSADRRKFLPRAHHPTFEKLDATPRPSAFIGARARTGGSDKVKAL